MGRATYRDRVFRSPAAETEVMADYDAVLAAWPVAHRVDVVPTALGPTSVVTSGPESGPHLVLLHGAGSHAMSWVNDIATFAAHRRTHVVDAPGDPGRSVGVVPERRPSVYARWLADVLDGLGVERADVVGISMGGWNALSLAVAQPRRVRSLTLLAPAGICLPRPRFLLAAVPLALLGPAGRRVVDRWIAGDGLDRRALAYVDHLARDLRPRIDIPRIFTDDELRSLSMPVLAVAGGRDAIYDAGRVTGRLRRLVPRANVVLLARAGHALLGLAGPVAGFLDGRPPVAADFEARA
jgi:pimeloyl-ACP methyl ester carboxylesterase